MPRAILYHNVKYTYLTVHLILKLCRLLPESSGVTVRFGAADGTVSKVNK